jgi:hypothetical protein
MSSDTPQERIEESLKTPYPADGKVWGALIAALASEFDDFEATLEDVDVAKFVDTATGQRLDRLGDVFDVDRETGESDDKYRIRIQVALRELFSSGTVQEIKSAIAVLLDVGESEVVIDEPYDVEAARIDVGVFESELEDRGISITDFDDFVDGLAAGGVGIETFALGTFMYVSEGEDPTVEGAERGYADTAEPETGGTYASLLQ